MNLSTRCFGIHQLPNDVAMCPLIDLINHDFCQEKINFFLTPSELVRKLLDIQSQKNEVQDYDQQVFEMS